MRAAQSEYSACLVIIGNEILSGRTQDANLQYVAVKLNEWGIRLREVRVVADVEDAIVEAIDSCRARFDYVFTTGGIGPTHDDITAASIAKAFGVRLVRNEKYFRLMEASYPPDEFNAARQKMCHLPAGAQPIENSVSLAPGFQIGNVFVMAGVPSIMRGMLQDVGHRLEGGAVVDSRTVRAKGVGESQISKGLEALETEAGGLVAFGSYPWFTPEGFGVHLVARSADAAALNKAASDLTALIGSCGGEPEEVDESSS